MAKSQQPPIPKSVCCGVSTLTLESTASFSNISLVPSVEWLSMTITLKEKSATCDKADWTASAIVRTRFRTGMMTDAITGKCSVFPSRGTVGSAVISVEAWEWVLGFSVAFSREAGKGVGTSSNSSGDTHAPISLRCRVHAFSISSCTSRAEGFT